MEAAKERQHIVDELKSAVKGIVDVGVRSRSAPTDGSEGSDDAASRYTDSLTEQSPSVRRLLRVVEEVLHHHIKPPLFGHVPKVWKYLENLDKCLPGTSSMLMSVRQYSDSDYARARLFIRLALNEQALSEYLSALAWNRSLTANYYKEDALLRDEESLDTIFLLLQNLNNFNFVLVLKDKELERPNYWDVVSVSSLPAAEPTKKSSQGSSALVTKDHGSPDHATPVANKTLEMEEYPEAVATTRRTKKRKGRPKRRSITLPSPPSLPRDEGTEDTSHKDGTVEERTLSTELSQDSSSEEDDDGDGDARPSQVDEVRIQPAPHQEVSHADRESISKSDDDEDLPAKDEDQKLEERLRRAQERLLELRSELSAAQASALSAAKSEDQQSPEREEDVSSRPRMDEGTRSYETSHGTVAGSTSRSTSEEEMNSDATRAEDSASDSSGTAIGAKSRARRPKRIVSIMEAPSDEIPHYMDKMSSSEDVQERINEGESTFPPAALSQGDVEIPPSSSVEQRENDLSSLLENLEAATHQFLIDEGALLESPVQTPPQPRLQSATKDMNDSRSPAVSTGSPTVGSFKGSDLSFEKARRNGDAWTASSSSSSSSSSSTTPQAASQFNKAELVSLLTSEITSGGAIEHHHEFYPASVSSSTGDSGYYSPSYVVSSPLADRANATTSRSKSPLAQASKPHGAALKDEELGEVTEAEFKSRQLNDPTGFLMRVVTKPSKPNIRCPSCSMSLADAGILGGIRFCNYSGLYYCPRCHQNQKVVIPACIISKWDMKEHKVSTWALEHIEANLNKATLNIATINPQLYKDAPPLAQVQEMRKQLVVMGEFIQTCKDRQRLMHPLETSQRGYLIESAHRYSLRDLVDVHKNRFAAFLKQILEEYATHITQVCDVCRGKAHFCELCQSEEDLVFPFQHQRIARCSECKSYFHKHCWQTRVVEGHEPCPKCERLRAMKERRQREAQREQELRELYGVASPQPSAQRRGSSAAGQRGAISQPATGRGLARSAVGAYPNRAVPGNGRRMGT